MPGQRSPCAADDGKAIAGNTALHKIEKLDIGNGVVVASGQSIASEVANHYESKWCAPMEHDASGLYGHVCVPPISGTLAQDVHCQGAAVPVVRCEEVRSACFALRKHRKIWADGLCTKSLLRILCCSPMNSQCV